MTASKSSAVLGRESLIAGVASVGILAHLWLRWGTDVSLIVRHLPLYVVLAAGGAPLVLDLGLKRGQSIYQPFAAFDDADAGFVNLSAHTKEPSSCFA